MQEDSHIALIQDLVLIETGHKTYFVSVTGNDAHDGAAWQTAKRSVFAALRLAGPGDEIRVSEGEYLETGLCLTPGIRLFGGFIAEDTPANGRDPHAHRTVLDGGGHEKPVLTCRGEGIVLDGLTIVSGSAGIRVTSGDTTVSHCRILDNTGYGLAVETGTLRLIHCMVAGNAGSGIYVSNGGVAVLTGNLITGNIGHGVSVLSGNATLENNTVFRNSFDGVYVYGTARLTNNTIVSNAENGVCMDGSGSGTLINNIVVFHGGYGIQKASSRSHVLLLRNNVFGNANGGFGGGTAGPSDIAADPLFADPDNGDFRLQPGSPCIDAGDGSALSLESDGSGSPNLEGGPVAIGAYAFLPDGPPVFVLQASE